MAAEAPGVGTELGPYRVIRPLGRGGRAEVFLARDLQLGRKVALKLAHAAAADQDLERLLDEARVTARLSHPNIVTIFGVGAHQGRPYLALEFVEGETLRSRLDGERERGGAPGPGEALRVAHAICLALEHAHRQGVLHRDLKPENVILGGDGRPRVLDFGLALRECGGDAPRQGTPPYMAPEQWRGERLGPATDIWALGVVLHELLAGRRPYPDLPLARLREEVLASRPVPLAPQLHEAARSLVGRCLDKNAAGRPTAGDAALELERLLRQATSAHGRNPYPGLRPFGPDEAPLFFGRQNDLSALVELLRHESLVAVVGPSGAGKTSFLQAGVLPRLGEQPGWLVLRLRPGPHPLEALARAIVSAQGAGPGPGTGDTVGLAGVLRQAPAMLGLVLEQLARDRYDQLLLVVDQLEDLSAADDPAEAEHFAEAVCLAADDPAAPVRVVLALRDDWISRIAVNAGIRAAVSRMRLFLLASPAPPALREVLEGPLAVVGCRFESASLVDEMVAEVEGEPVSLPLLQFAAHRMWERRDSAGVLRRAGYLEIGGVAGALADHGDAVLAALQPRQVDVARQLLLRLVTPEGARRLLAEDELLAGLGSDAPRVLEHLVAGRLAVMRRGDLDPDGHPVQVELVHESLVERWACLSRWLQASRGRRALAEEVEQASALWDRRGRPRQELWHGDALAEALPLLQPGELLSARSQAFLREGRRRAAGAARLRLGLTLAVLGLAAVVAVLLSRAGAPTSGHDASVSEQPEAAVRRWARARLQAAGAALLAGNLVRARAEVRASLEALDTAPARVLWWRLDRKHLLWKQSAGTEVLHLAFGADGRTLAAAGAEGTLWLLDPATGGRRASLRTDPVVALAAAGDGVAAATPSGQVLLWSIPPGREPRARRQVLQAGRVRTLAFADDGALLAAALENGTIRIWRIPSLALHRTLRAPGAVALAFGPGGRTLAAASSNRVLLWQVSGGDPRQLVGHADVRALSFSPDGQRLASGCAAGTVRVWSTRTGRVEQVITRAGPTRGLGFATDRLLLGASGDGVWAREIGPGEERELLQLPRAKVALDRAGLRVAAIHDNTLQMWSLTAPTPVERGHRGAVLDVSLAPDGRILASAGADGTVRLWDPVTGDQRDVLLGHVGPVRSVSLHPDGLHLASGGDDGTVRSWSLERGVEVQVLSRGRRRILAVCASPDGDRVAWGASDGTVGISQPATGGVQLLGRHRAAVLALAFSPDGALVASASADRTARLWRVAGGGSALAAALVGHGSRVTGVAFVGAEVITGSDDRTVRAWHPDGRPGPTLPADVGAGVRLAGLQRGVAVASHGRPLERCTLGDSGWSCVPQPGGAVRANGLSTAAGLLAVAREDGTVGLLAPAGPVWRAPLLLSSPATLLSHRGWTPLAPPTVRNAPRARWARAVERALAASAGPTLVCNWTGERLELWDRRADRRLWQRKQALDGLRQVLAVPDGCLTLAAGVARLHGPQGAKQLVSPAAAIAAGPGVLLAASGREVVRFDPRGRRTASQPGIGVTALQLAGEQLTLGFADGSVEITRPGTPTPAPIRLRPAASSPITALATGPLGTLFVGQASGDLEGWLPDSGSRFYQGKLHGPLTHLLMENGWLYAASSVGDHLALDLGPLQLDHCQLLRRVWRRVRVLWEKDGAVIRGPPRGHRCLAARP